MKTKDQIRKQLRALRQEHVTGLPGATRALLFLRPPTPLLDLVPEGATIGLYRATPFEAPAASYAKFFFERGHALALPRFETRGSPMTFAAFADPFEESDLQTGPFGLMQPAWDATPVQPDVLFVPLLGFTERGDRLGQGGGHYDRWLSDHPATVSVGLAWDVQLVEELPVDPHDQSLCAIVTPTRFFGPFA